VGESLRGIIRVRRRIAIFVLIVQSILFLIHFFLYATWTMFWGEARPQANSTLQLTLALLSMTFISASLLGYRYSNVLVRMYYTISAVWLGFVNFGFVAACACWVFYGGLRVFGLHPDRRLLASIFLGLAILATLYGMANAARTRVKKITVKLPNLPESWRGRVAAQVSDLHLGHVRNVGFIRRVVTMLTRLRPDVVFITGDLYDGLAVDLERLSEPWAEITAPLGAYFITGNHEEFSDRTKYLDSLKRFGVRILNNEKIIVDGLQIVGLHYRDAVPGPRFRSLLKDAALDREQASVLLVHEPRHLTVAEEEGISLQLSGHTHRGQFFPFTRIVSRIYKQYAYGLQRLGDLLVYTTCGTGTWGPPMRVGTNPEIVLILFE
jgi:predicted MPP superfamily phosphohydrolase